MAALGSRRLATGLVRGLLLTSQKHRPFPRIQGFSSEANVKSWRLFVTSLVPRIIRYVQKRHLLGTAATVGVGVCLYGGTALCSSNTDLSKYAESDSIVCVLLSFKNVVCFNGQKNVAVGVADYFLYTR